MLKWLWNKILVILIALILNVKYNEVNNQYPTVNSDWDVNNINIFDVNGSSDYENVKKYQNLDESFREIININYSE